MHRMQLMIGKLLPIVWSERGLGYSLGVLSYIPSSRTDATQVGVQSVLADWAKLSLQSPGLMVIELLGVLTSRRGR